MFLAEVAGNDHPQRVTVPIRQRRAIHFVGKQRRRCHRFFERDSVSVIIDAVQAHPRGAGKHAGLVKQIPQRKTFPHGIADQTRIQAVTDTHKRCLLRGGFESH